MGGYGMGMGLAREAMIPLANNPEGVQQGMAGAITLSDLLQNQDQRRQMFPYQLQQAQQEGQLRQAAIMEAQAAQQDQQGLQKAYADAQGDPQQFLKNLQSPQYPISLGARQKTMQNLLATSQQYAGLTPAQVAQQKFQADATDSFFGNVNSAPAQQRAAVWGAGLAALGGKGVDVSKYPQLYPGDDQFQILQYANRTHQSFLTDAANAPSNKTVTVDQQEMNDWLAKNPGKGAADFMAYKARLGRDPAAASDRQFREGQQSYQYSSNALDNVGKPIEQLVQRMGRLKDTLAQANPQADALVAPELLTVMAGGMGSGLRMNEAEISRIVGGRNAWQSLKSSILRYQADPSKPFLITPAQRGQINALLDEVSGKLQAKQQILDDARQQLATTNDPMQHRQILTRARNRLMTVDGQAGNTAGRLSPAGQAYLNSITGQGNGRP